MPFARSTDGTAIHYDVFGEQGPFVVLLQGLGLSGRFWFTIPEELATDPTAPQRVLVIDNRGTGRSDAPRVPWRMSTMADDVAAVLDAAGAPSAVVVGISLGGMVAQHVAIRHPTRVDGLVLLATMAGIGSGRLPSARAVSWFLTLPFGRRGARNLARLLLPEAELPRAREHFAGWRHVIRAEPLSARAFVYHLGAVLTHSTRRELATIRCPTVIVAGAADVLVPPRNSELLANAIPGATLELLPGVAHGIPILDPQIVHRTLRRIRGHVRGS